MCRPFISRCLLLAATSVILCLGAAQDVNREGQQAARGNISISEDGACVNPLKEIQLGAHSSSTDSVWWRKHPAHGLRMVGLLLAAAALVFVFLQCYRLFDSRGQEGKTRRLSEEKPSAHSPPGNSCNNLWWSRLSAQMEFKIWCLRNSAVPTLIICVLVVAAHVWNTDVMLIKHAAMQLCGGVLLQRLGPALQHTKEAFCALVNVLT
ncbi:hypothetical protein Efla_002137 [Eimeria flavescens]